MHRFDVKTIKNVEFRRKTTKLVWSNYNVLHRFDVKTIKTFELGGKTTKLIKLQWIATIWHSKRSKTVQKSQHNAKLQKWSNYNELHRFDVKTIKKCWVTSQNIQNYAKLQKWSNYNELHRFVKTSKLLS